MSGSATVDVATAMRAVRDAATPELRADDSDDSRDEDEDEEDEEDEHAGKKRARDEEDGHEWFRNCKNCPIGK